MKVGGRVLVLVSGQSGCGKTTLGQNLKEKCGFVHFDGDTFAHGGRAEEFSGFATAEMLAKGDEHVKQTYAKVVEQGFGPLLRGEPCPPLQVWKPFLDLLCHDVLRVWNSYPLSSLVVTFSVYPKFLRDYIRRFFSPTQMSVVVLNDVASAAVERKMAQVMKAAEGQKIQDFLGKFGGDWAKAHEMTDEECVQLMKKKMMETENGFEKAGDDEIGIDVTNDTKSDDVLQIVKQKLNI